MAFVSVVTATAYAHPAVDEGKRHLRRARFERALAAFARAESSDDLSRADLVELLEARCMLYLATQQPELLQNDLVALASLEPDHTFGREAPPELQSSFDVVSGEHPGRLEIVAQAEAVSGGVVLSARAENDPASLVRRFRVHVRTGDEPFRVADSQRQDVPDGGTLDYYVEAIGPGGAVLLTAGTADDPRVASTALGDVGEGEDEGGGSALPWILVGVGVAVAAGAVVAVLLLTGSSGTQPEYPMVVGF